VQYSSNSNEAMRSIVRSKPTLVGQYRQAILEFEKRSHDLQRAALSLEKQRQEIRLKRVQLGKLIAQISDAEELQCRQTIATLEIQEAELDLNQTIKLTADAERELQVCQDEIERIKAIAPVDFATLDENQFQFLMSEEFKLRRVRHLVAQTVSHAIGFRPEVIEVLLEIPDEERSEYFQLHQEMAAGLLSAIAPKQIEAEKLNGAH
jgi:hypothetical protein